VRAEALPVRRVRDGVITADLGLVGEGLEPYAPVTVEVRDGVVRRVEEGRERGGRSYDALLPAPFNAHVHAADWAFRHAGLGRPLERVVAPPDGLKHRLLREVDEGELEGAISGFLAASLRFGCPGVADFREGGPEGVRLGLRAAGRVGFPEYVPMGRPGSWEPERLEEELRRLRAVTEFVGVPDVHLPGEALEAVRDSGLRVFVHVNESWRSVRECVREHGVTELERAVELLEPDGVVHCVVLTGRDEELLRELDPLVVLCPRSNEYFELGVPEVERLRGLRLALGTDNGMCVEPDVWEEARYAWLRLGMRPVDALRAATVTPARFFGLPVLEEGEWLRAVGLKGVPALDRVAGEGLNRVVAHLLQVVKLARVEVLLGEGG